MLSARPVRARVAAERRPGSVRFVVGWSGADSERSRSPISIEVDRHLDRVLGRSARFGRLGTLGLEKDVGHACTKAQHAQDT